MSKKTPDLWSRPERLAAKNQPGPLYDEAQRLSRLMSSERKRLVKESDAAGTRLKRPEIAYKTFDDDGKTVTQLVEAHVVKGDPNIYLAYDSDSSNDEMTRYSITPDGMITNIDMYSDPIDPKSEEFALIKRAMEVVARAMEDDQRDREYRLERRKRTAARTVSAIGAFGLAASSVTFAFNRLVLEPRRDEQDRRDAYDSQNYALPGEAVPIDTYDFGELSRGDFAAIPKRRDGEPLTHPRVVEIDSTNGCVDIDAKATYSEELVAAAQVGDELLDYTYQIDTSQDGITLCVVDNHVGGNIAIQSRPTSE